MSRQGTVVRWQSAGIKGNNQERTTGAGGLEPPTSQHIEGTKPDNRPKRGNVQAKNGPFWTVFSPQWQRSGIGRDVWDTSPSVMHLTVGKSSVNFWLLSLWG